MPIRAVKKIVFDRSLSCIEPSQKGPRAQPVRLA
jgi:hypothetical protein